jgi:hypothetical protein
MAVHPKPVLGYTPVVIILTVQILRELSHRSLTEGDIKDIIIKKTADITGDELGKRIIPILARYMTEYAKKVEN